MIRIYVENENRSLLLAAETFAGMWEKVTSRPLEITREDDGKSDLIVMGSDILSSFTHQKRMDKLIPRSKVRVGTDDYGIFSAKEGGRTLLFLSGGNTRAYFYAVYHFFELAASCRYFWDGDRIPHKDHIVLEGWDIYESPRFSYRGLRYFAHRGLHRFQAEHWEWEDWKREMDLLLKKRFNLFMLRIGMDDLFQKAFPEEVPYPEGFTIEGSIPRSYDDHTLFMPLAQRGELRKKILSYAFERDLIHPEDIGTMTHWYSRTPMDFVRNIQPAFLPSASRSYYADPTGQVWDIRKERELDLYFRLTETHIKEYGKATGPELFHTIGLAERHCFDDEEASHEMKLYTYGRFTRKLREKYPHIPLMLASWEFLDWTPEQVRELLASLDPEHTIVLDYIEDIQDEKNYFVTWDLPGKFPYIFGIFHSNENNSEIRGNYPLIEERWRIAAKDPMCKGVILWPETSHADTLMLEYVAANAWDASCLSIDSFLEKFCSDRYGQDEKLEKRMLALYRQLLPAVKKRIRHAFKHPKAISPLFYIRILEICALEKSSLYLRGQNTIDAFREPLKAFPELLQGLSLLAEEALPEYGKRDILDIAKSASATILDTICGGIFVLLKKWEEGENSPAAKDRIRQLLALQQESNLLLAEILSASKEFSLYDSLLRMTAKEDRNKDFEYTLKGNAENSYSRSYIPEILKGCVAEELELFTARIEEGLAQDVKEWVFPEGFRKEREKVRDKFYLTPLAELAPDPEKAGKALACNLAKMGALSHELNQIIKEI